MFRAAARWHLVMHPLWHSTLQQPHAPLDSARQASTILQDSEERGLSPPPLIGDLQAQQEKDEAAKAAQQEKDAAIKAAMEKAAADYAAGAAKAARQAQAAHVSRSKQNKTAQGSSSGSCRGDRWQQHQQQNPVPQQQRQQCGSCRPRQGRAAAGGGSAMAQVPASAAAGGAAAAAAVKNVSAAGNFGHQPAVQPPRRPSSYTAQYQQQHSFGGYNLGEASAAVLLLLLPELVA